MGFKWLDFQPALDGEYHLPEVVLCNMADEIAELFLKLRMTYTSKQVALKQHHAMAFYKAAIICRDRQLSPQQYVRQQLQGMSLTGKFWPSAIASEVIADLAPTQQKLNDLDIARYKATVALFSALSKTLGPTAVLEDQLFQLTPLLRVILAASYELPHIVDQYLDDAVEEYEASIVAQELFAESFRPLHEGHIRRR